MNWRCVFTGRLAATVVLISAALALGSGCRKTTHQQATELRWFWVEEIPGRSGAPSRKPKDPSQVFVVIQLPRESLKQFKDLKAEQFKLHGADNSVFAALELSYVTNALGTDNQKEQIQLIAPAKRTDAENANLELQYQEEPKVRLVIKALDNDFKRAWLLKQQ